MVYTVNEGYYLQHEVYGVNCTHEEYVYSFKLMYTVNMKAMCTALS